MIKIKKHLALLLCAALLLSLFGCAKPAEETVPPTTEPPVTEPAAVDIYAESAAALEAAADVTLNISSSTRVYVDAHQFAKGSDQVLVYTGLGTDSPAISSVDTVNYDGLNYVEYREVYTDGTLYLDAEDSNTGTVSHFSTEATAEEAIAQYLPVVLLDAALYGSVSMEETKDGTEITFSAATAAESWAAPEGCELTEATGTALLNAEGALTRYTYSIVYQYGPTKVTLEVTSDITLNASAVQAPSNSNKYTPVADPDAVRLYNEASCYMAQAEVFSSSVMESTLTQAAGMIRNQAATLNLHSTDTDLNVKVDTSVYANIMGQDHEYELEELYTDGTYSVSENGGESQWDSSVTSDMMWNYATNMLFTSAIAPEFWQDVTVTDLGSLYLVEFNITEAGGGLIIENVCEDIFSNPNLLDQYATDSGINEVKGYFALDQYTHLPTAMGYNLDAYHVIEGEKCLLTYQLDQSYEIPSQSAYHTITDEYPAEAKPIDTATPLFYHVTGDDGQEMWLLGTIHVGDERTAYLPQEIYDAFDASDALALEFSSGRFDEMLEKDDKLSKKVSDCYYYSDTTAADVVADEELYETALMYMKATGNYNMNAPYLKLSIWSQGIDNFYTRQAYHLTGMQGVDNRLERRAEDQGKEILDVESGLFQIQMMTGWSDALQVELLKDSIETDVEESWESLDELYELWCAGDEAALREELSDEVDTSEMTEEELAEYEELKPLIEEYNKAMSYDRNEDMLQVAIDYLESGDVVFYAVGLAHLLDNTNGLVDTLREAGYTVELVSYS